MSKKSATKRALITGVTGQDGAYLARLLLEKGYEVYGIHRQLSSPNFWRLLYLGIMDRITLIPTELTDSSSVFSAIKQSQPDEIYHLAGQSFVGNSFEHPVSTADITGLGVPRILEAIRSLNPRIRFYLASTIELYGRGDSKPLTEKTYFRPSNPYAVAKLYGYWISDIYRNGYGIYTCNGILFNHESPLRSLEFVTRKITNTAARIYLGIDHELKLGNLDVKRDWGYAPEYVKSMWMMLQQDEPDDYLIATNETHTVRNFVEKAFGILGLDWEKYVKVDKKLIRPLDANFLQGDYSKARVKLGWEPKVKFDQLVEIMVREDMERWERWLNGERFAWDVPNFQLTNNKIRKSKKI